MAGMAKENQMSMLLFFVIKCSPISSPSYVSNHVGYVGLEMSGPGHI
jgi:hypothetical protein